jgi:hypothetical protein
MVVKLIAVLWQRDGAFSSRSFCGWRNAMIRGGNLVFRIRAVRQN